MLEKLADPRFSSISKPSQHALDLLERVLETNPAPIVCEVGIGIGATSIELCRRLDNRGIIHFYDYQEKLDDLKADLDAQGFYNTVWVGNTRRTFDSYSWKLSKLLLECRILRVDGLFDFVFLDGAHAFHHDAPAALALKDLLKPGGYLLFDDYDWTFKISPTMNPDVNPEIAEQYSDDQIAAPHVRLICDVFFDADPQFQQVDIGYKNHEHRRAYRKLPAPETASRNTSVAGNMAALTMALSGSSPAQTGVKPDRVSKAQDKSAGLRSTRRSAPGAPASTRSGEKVSGSPASGSPETGSQALGPVLLFGTFDVQTFGDLMFPLIARSRLAERGLDMTAVSPTGMAAGWPDTVASISVDDAATAVRSASAILIGGGNIVHFGAANLADYKVGTLFDSAYPRLWFGASLLGALYNKPVLWNAPGVPRELAGAEQIRFAKSALQAADYVSLRDDESLAFLGEAAANVDINVLPDTAAAIADVIPRPALEEAFRTLLDRKAVSADESYLVIHPKLRAFDNTPEMLAEQVGAFATAHGLTPMLLAISPCHDDQIAVRRVSRAMRVPHVQLDDPRSLTEIASAIANAGLYIGASLHGYITASSYGVPGVLVARPLLPKFSGYMRHIGRPDDLAEDWAQALEKGGAALAAGKATDLPTTVDEALDAHWDRIAATISAGTRPNPGRLRLLRRYAQTGLTKRGWDWLLAPVIDTD